MYKCFDDMRIDTLTTDTIHEQMLFQFFKISQLYMSFTFSSHT